MLPLEYIAGGPTLVGPVGSGSIMDCDLAFVNKVVVCDCLGAWVVLM